MQATLSTTHAELPFTRDLSPVPAGGRSEHNADWVLRLRHATIRFSAQDRLVLLHGHPLVFRLGLYAAAEQALSGDPVVYLDGAHTFDPFFIARMARAHRRQPRALLSLIHVARAFSCLQLERLISDCLMSALDRYQARIAVVSGLFDTLYDQAVPEHEGMRLFGRMMEATQKLTQQGYIVLALCPQAPMLTRASRRCLDQLRGQADRVIRVEECQGVVKLHDEADQRGQYCEIPRTLLEIA